MCLGNCGCPVSAQHHTAYTHDRYATILKNQNQLSMKTTIPINPT
jgi:hypothetical protein